jgi:ribosomal protein L40E
MKRQHPRQHIVKAHKRLDTVVRSYRRGVPKPPVAKRHEYVPSYLDTKDYLPGTNIPIHWERMGGPETTTKVWMSPEEFLSYTTPPDYSTGFSKESLKGLDEAFAKGEELYSPYLTVRYRDNQVTGHEGRHRAYWAIKHGIKKIPVYIVWDDNTGHFAGKMKTKFGKLKTQGLYEREKLKDRYETHGFYSALDVAEGIPIHMFKIPEKPKKAPKIHKTYMYMGLEDKPRIMASEKKNTDKICWDCGRQNMAYDYQTKKWVCLSCGAIQ